jgi:hypothetical protein
MSILPIVNKQKSKDNLMKAGYLKEHIKTANGIFQGMFDRYWQNMEIKRKLNYINEAIGSLVIAINKIKRDR